MCLGDRCAALARLSAIDPDPAEVSMNALIFRLPAAMVLLLAMAWLPAGAQPKDAPLSIGDIAMYQGQDRMQRLVAGAGREGTLNLYTSVNKLQHDSPIIKAFQQKYGVKVTVWRANSEKLLQRIMTEAQTKRFDVDIVTNTGFGMEALRREKLLQEAASPLFSDLIPAALPAHKEWVGTYVLPYVQAYNTSLVQKKDLPHTYHDLLDPKWKDRIAIEAEDYEWFYSVVKDMGEEKGLQFFRDLVARNKLTVRTGHSLLANLVASGEVPLALTVYHYTPEQLKQKGAPIDWFVIEPAIVGMIGTGVARNAPHPHAAVLFYEYLLSEEAQKLWAEMSYSPVNRNVPSPLKGIEIKAIDPTVSLDESDKWMKLYQSIVLQKTSR
jgi:iron(III) transport system substrate-binding protein